MFTITVLPELFKQRGGTQTAVTRFSFFSNQNKIEDIKTKQAEAAANIIHLQFRMEQLVYCQDQIYSEILQRIREQAFNADGSMSQAPSLKLPASNNQSSVSSITEIGMHLNAYFLVSVGARGPCGGTLIARCLPGRRREGPSLL